MIGQNTSINLYVLSAHNGQIDFKLDKKWKPNEPSRQWCHWHMPIPLQSPLNFVCFRVVWNVLASICDVFPTVQWNRRVFLATNKITFSLPYGWPAFVVECGYIYHFNWLRQPARHRRSGIVIVHLSNFCSVVIFTTKSLFFVWKIWSFMCERCMQPASGCQTCDTTETAHTASHLIASPDLWQNEQKRTNTNQIPMFRC